MGERLHSRGHVELICGSMFSGKTEELMRRLRRAEIVDQPIQVFKSNLDTRYDPESLASHADNRFAATPISSSREILEKIRPDTTIVAIDEVQFFDENIVDVVNRLASEGKRVITAALDTDFRGVPFGPVPDLMARAEEVDKLHAICVCCKEPASMTQRLVNGNPAAFDDPVVMVGAKEDYEARCRHCHEVAPPRLVEEPLSPNGIIEKQ